MQNSAWIELLRLIPENQYAGLMATTTSGTEINIQAIVRIQPDYLVLRGRLAGSMDQGKIFFLPYDRIQLIGFREEVKEADVQALFAGYDAGAAAAPLEAKPAPQDEPDKSSPPAAPPSKAALLDRLRKARAAQEMQRPK